MSIEATPGWQWHLPPQIQLNVPEALLLAFDHLRVKQFDQAERLFRAVHEAEPTNFEAVNGLGTCLSETNRHAEALPLFGQAMALCRDNLLAVSFNYARSLGEIGQSEQALKMMNGIHRAFPDQPISHLHLNRGIVLMQLEQWDEAIVELNRSMELNPHGDNTSAIYSRGFANLVLGNYREGFEGYEYRMKTGDIPGLPEWKGEDLTGKRILVHEDQGLGDNIQYMRFVPALVERAARVYCVMDMPVRPLAEQIPGVTMLSRDRDTWPKLDYWARMMSLAYAFGVTQDTIPPPVEPRYDTQRLIRWHDRFGPEVKLRVGLVWSGNPLSKYDAHRSIPLRELAPFYDVPGVQFYSLQLDLRDSDREAFERAPLTDISPYLTDFSETAHCMRCLDLMITCDTSVAHMAGTVGVPTIVMLTKYRTYWVWIRDREDSPWYPSIKIMRQKTDGDWSEVVGRVRDDLASRAFAHTVSISAG